jgi:F0F1-type ATP synthase assembly protein I
MFFLGATASKLEKSERIKFLLNAMSLSRMGQIGLVLLLLSGGYLMTPYWKALGSMPLLMIKLFLFLGLGALIGILSSTGKKAKQGEPEKHLSKAKNLGSIALLIAVTIVVLAVLVFH